MVVVVQLLEAQHPKVLSFEDPVKLNVGGIKYLTLSTPHAAENGVV